MIVILDTNGNKITIHNAAFQTTESGTTCYYESAAKVQWLATVLPAGTITLTSLARYSIEPATSCSLDEILSQIKYHYTREKLSPYKLNTLKHYLKFFNSKSKSWAPGYDKQNFL